MQELKNKILQEFLNSNTKIKSLNNLKKYIAYCIVNNQGLRLKSQTSYHHILPEASFSKYSELNYDKWNGSHLLYSDHYYAHWLLTEAIDDLGQLNAFTKMHNCDVKNGRITENDLIPVKDFQLKMEERSIKHKLWNSTIEDGEVLSNKELRLNKMTATRNKEFLDADGEYTTIAKQSAQKHWNNKSPEDRIAFGRTISKTKTKELLEEANRKRKVTMNIKDENGENSWDKLVKSKRKKYLVKDNENNIILEGLYTMKDLFANIPGLPIREYKKALNNHPLYINVTHSGSIGRLKKNGAWKFYGWTIETI